MTKKWYIVQAYSGFEKKVKSSLEERIKRLEMDAYFGDILVPAETVQVQTKSQNDGYDDGPRKPTKTRNMNRNFYPGYVFVEMELNDQTWHLVKDTPKVSGFVGGRNPAPVPPSEIANINQQVVEGQVKVKPKVAFEVGETVRVIEMNSTGTVLVGQVLEVDTVKQKLKVVVSIFGRPTKVDVDFMKVEKMS